MKNKESIIPVEVEEVWTALNTLKIVKQSKARDFKAEVAMILILS